MAKLLQKFFRNSDSIISLIVGLTMVLIIGMLTYSIISTMQQQKQASTKQSEILLPTTYTVKENDTLWNIAITYYKSGYNWVDIAKANTLDNPDALAVGQTLTIPDTQPIIVEVGDILDGATTDTTKPQTSEVTVKQGESLWSIAEREYGSGYKWVDIAKANVIITEPDIIYPNTILRLP